MNASGRVDKMHACMHPIVSSALPQLVMAKVQAHSFKHTFRGGERQLQGERKKNDPLQMDNVLH